MTIMGNSLRTLTLAGYICNRPIAHGCEWIYDAQLGCFGPLMIIFSFVVDFMF